MYFFRLTLLLLVTFAGAYAFEIPKECVGREPYAVGVCRKSFSGYFFNIMSKECQKYETGGCYLKAGNAHSFSTKVECLTKCKEPIEAAGRSE